MHAQNHSEMCEEEKFVCSLANRAQANDKKRAESSDGENSSLDESSVDIFWFQNKAKG